MKVKSKDTIKITQKKGKYFYSCWWFWIIILVLIIANFLLLLSKDNMLGNILTIISGWISGIATIFIGIIATRQNKRYKLDTDEYNRKQEQLIKNQYNFEVFKDIVSRRSKMISNIKDELDIFCNKFNYMNISALLAEIYAINLENPQAKISETPQIKQLYNYQSEITLPYTKVKQMINNDWLYTKRNYDLIEILDKYYIQYVEMLRNIDYTNIQKTIESINKTMGELALKLMQKKLEYTAFLDVDLNMVLLQRGQDLDFIRKHYSYTKENNNG
jgi:hypothetical protein